MSNTARTERVTHEVSWDYRDADIVHVKPGSVPEILKAYLANLTVAIGGAEVQAQGYRRFAVDVPMRHRDEENDKNVGLQFFVDTVTPVGREHGVWLIAGHTTDAQPTRVELLSSKGEVILVTLTKIVNAPVGATQR
jgi:hypothetical protein